MKTSVELRQEIGELFDQCEAITAVATEENRGLDAAEQKDVDAILAEIGEERGPEGRPTGKWAEVKRAERIESHRQRLVEQRVGGLSSDTREDGLPQFVIPKAARYGTKKLRSFVGDGGDYEAYYCGRTILARLNHEPSIAWCRDHGIDVRAALSTGDNTLGGFLVPAEMDSRIIDLREQYGVFRQYAYGTSMGSDSKTVPRRKSGLTAYAVGDNDTITASDKNWQNVELIAKKWGVLSLYSSEIDEDAVISIADNLADEMAYAFSLKEDQCGFIGDGTSTYHGIRGITVGIGSASVATAASGNVSFETLDLDDFEAAMGKLPEYAAMGAAWYISRVGYYASMARLMAAGGGNAIQDLGRGPELVFMGHPVRISQVLNTTSGTDASAIKALFGRLDLSSTLGTRRGTSITVSTDRYFELDQIGIKGTTRFAINNHDVGDSTNAGPVVAVKTAAS